MDNPRSVASQTEAVESRCGDIIRCIDTNDGSTNISSEDVVDVWDKFKLWAGNIGARQSPNSAASLESRLKGARRVLEQVVRLLNDIQEALDDLFEIASGNLENRFIPSTPELIDKDPTSVQSSGLSNVGGSKLEKYEDQDLLELLSKSVGSLLKITILIRKATPRDRFAKALQGSNPFMDDFDIAYVAERYPKLGTPDAQWLCERLGRAITKRRQFLRNSRDHSRRIAGREDIDPVVPQRSHHSMEHHAALSVANARSTTLSTASGIHTNYSGSYAAHAHASTKASTPDIAELCRVEMIESENEDTKSYVSSGSSFHRGKADSTLHLPTLEEVSQGSEVFECPICFDIQTISKETSWRRHVFQDLKAYVCTGQGTCDTKFFGDSQSWLDHELQCHRQQWACILCQQGLFRNKEIYEDHLSRTHGAFIVGDDQLAAFVGAGLRAVDAIPARDCPFCDEWADSMQSTIPPPDSTTRGDVAVTVDPKQYRRHVSKHLEQLALFSLPRHRDGDLNDNTSEGANLSHATINQLESSPFEDERESDEEWIPDPPLHIAAARGDFKEVKRLIDDGADIHLRGETWGSVLDAALAYHGAYDSNLLGLFRRELGDHQADDEAPTGEQSSSAPKLMSTPMTANQSGALKSPKSKKHKCPYCETEFTRYHNLKSHLLTHSQEKPFVCPACQMRFRRLHDLKRHGKLHTGEKPLVCPNCDRKFARSDSLARHSEGPGGCVRRRGSLGFETEDYSNLDVKVATPTELEPLGSIINFGADTSTIDNGSSSTELFTTSNVNTVGYPEAYTSYELAGRNYPFEFDAGTHYTVDVSQLYEAGGIRTESSQATPFPDSHDLSYETMSRDQSASSFLSPYSGDYPWLSFGAMEGSFAYTNLSDDIDPDGPRSRAGSREGFNRGYYQPSDGVIGGHLRPPPSPTSETTHRAAADIERVEYLPVEADDNVYAAFRQLSVIDESPGINNIPPGARWTKINRNLVSIEALRKARNCSRVRDDFVIVLRVLSKEEIQQYAIATANLISTNPRMNL
ncbi:hypothetical protein PG994_003443 [Apiospora phragmitis]|uniref:C2H2-type domain-containing protein n=1 Tax=Apiospora phragmitis TaxID=2905665 RepID=A0ABR1VY53_9PEZI